MSCRTATTTTAVPAGLGLGLQAGREPLTAALQSACKHHLCCSALLPQSFPRDAMRPCALCCRRHQPRPAYIYAVFSDRRKTHALSHAGEGAGGGAGAGCG
eukprot:gene7153-469_t